MAGRRRITTLLAGAVLGCAAPLATAGPASATALPVGQCTTTSGVILAVDFSHWAGPLLRACGSTPTNGYALLNQGGWHSTGTGHDGPGFICRIAYNGYSGGAAYPTSAEEPCTRTPTGAAWSYWHADVGQSSWTLSPSGAADTSPGPGSVDAWSYGSASGVPGFTPDSVRAHNSTPAGSGSGGSGSGGSGSGGSGSGGSSAGRPVAGSPSAAPDPRVSQASGHGPTGGAPSAGSTGPDPDTLMAHGKAGSAAAAKSASAHRSAVRSLTRSASGSASGATSTPGQPIDAAPAEAAAPGSHGSALPAVLGGVLVTLLAAGGAFTAWQRRARTD